MTAQIDQLIALFNAKAMDLPDGLFDRKTQFVLNGAPFETLLGQPPNDPLVLMLTRGPAGYRFMTKALQHALPDAKVERGEQMNFWLSGHLRGTGEAMNTVIGVVLKFAPAGWLAVAEATIEADALDKLRAARVLP